MSNYAKAPKDVLDRAHLLDIQLRIDFLFAHAPLDKDEQPKGPAIKLHGCPCHAKARAVSLKDRVKGQGDVEITIDISLDFEDVNEDAGMQ